MRKIEVYGIFILVILAGAYINAPQVHALGHYGIPGTYEGGCNVCHDFINGDYAPASGNLRWIRSTIEWPAGTVHAGVTYTQISDETLPYEGTMADGNDSDLDGPCEVCHTNTNYHTNLGDGINHLDGTYCTACHPHFSEETTNYFQPSFTGTQAHATHWTDPKGPLLGEDNCVACHLSSDYSLFADGLSLSATTVCDPCHSPGGSFDGSVDAKAKWVDGVYTGDGTQLQAGNENWCASCHDSGTSVVSGVDAPDVMGDNTSWGYNHTGHGKFAVSCEDCHDLSVSHTDGEARTYSATLDNYRAGYRLNEDMAVPRNGENHPQAFRLCTNCHIYTDIVGPDSNFRDDASGQQYHELHLNNWGASTWASDSDFDAPVDCEGQTCGDSAITCIICHNVHGPPNMAMVRHGELMSSPGTTDKVPGFRFRWYKDDGTTQTYSVEESQYGSLLCTVTFDFSGNHACTGCHTDEPVLTWYRSSFGIDLESVWTTNASNVTKTSFYPGENIRYHARFTLSGPDQYIVRIADSKAGNDSSMAGTDWVTQLNDKQGKVYEGTYSVHWDKTIPLTADPGSPAQVIVKIGMADSTTYERLDQDNMTWSFNIVSAP